MAQRFGHKSARAEIIYTCAICHMATDDLDAHEPVCRVPAPRIHYARCDRCSTWTCNIVAHAANPCAAAVAVVDAPQRGAGRAKAAAAAPRPSAEQPRRTVKAILRRPAAPPAARPKQPPTPATIFILDEADAAREPEILESVVDLLGVIPGTIGAASAGSRSVWAMPPASRESITVADLRNTFVGGRLALYDAIVKVSEEISGPLKIIAIVAGPDRGSRNKCDPLLEFLAARTDLRIEIIQVADSSRDTDYAKICSGRGSYILADGNVDSALVASVRAV